MERRRRDRWDGCPHWHIICNKTWHSDGSRVYGRGRWRQILLLKGVPSAHTLVYGSTSKRSFCPPSHDLPPDDTGFCSGVRLAQEVNFWDECRSEVSWSVALMSARPVSQFPEQLLCEILHTLTGFGSDYWFHQTFNLDSSLADWLKQHRPWIIVAD